MTKPIESCGVLIVDWAPTILTNEEDCLYKWLKNSRSYKSQVFSPFFLSLHQPYNKPSPKSLPPADQSPLFLLFRVSLLFCTFLCPFLPVLVCVIVTVLRRRDNSWEGLHAVTKLMSREDLGHRTKMRLSFATSRPMAPAVTGLLFLKKLVFFPLLTVFLTLITVL